MGPGDKLKNFMQKFIKPKNQGQVTGVKNRKLAKGLTGDPYKDVSQQSLYLIDL